MARKSPELTPAELLIAHRCEWTQVQQRKWVITSKGNSGYQYSNRQATPCEIRSKIARRERIVRDYSGLAHIVEQINAGVDNLSTADKISFFLDVSYALGTWGWMKQIALQVGLTKKEAEGKTKEEIEMLILAEKL